MKQFMAISLNGAGAIMLEKEDEEKEELKPKHVRLGQFPSLAAATQKASEKLECPDVYPGVVCRGGGLGGFLIVNEEQLAAYG
ncbi:hypothetical protein [Enterovibrio norvegicus]|uniref:hypothetical protein n=1 Tax=Enterovibrio norvegicus TaxID=188144 RepID=UPI00354B25CE